MSLPTPGAKSPLQVFGTINQSLATKNRTRSAIAIPGCPPNNAESSPKAADSGARRNSCQSFAPWLLPGPSPASHARPALQGRMVKFAAVPNCSCSAHWLHAYGQGCLVGGVQRAPPNPSLEARPNGKPPAPRGSAGYHPPRGAGALPSVPPQLKR